MPHKPGHYYWDDDSSQLLFGDEDEDEELFQVDGPGFGVPGGDVGPAERPGPSPYIPIDQYGDPHQGMVPPAARMGEFDTPTGVRMGAHFGHWTENPEYETENVLAYWEYINERKDEAKANPHTLKIHGQDVDAEQYWQNLIDNYHPAKSMSVKAQQKERWAEWNRDYEAEVDRLEALGASPDEAHSAADRNIGKPSPMSIDGVQAGRYNSGLDPEAYAAHLLQNAKRIEGKNKTTQRRTNVATQVRNDPNLIALLNKAQQIGLADWRALRTSTAGPLRAEYDALISGWSTRHGEDFSSSHQEELEKVWVELRHKAVVNTPDNQAIVNRKRQEWIDAEKDPARFDPDEALRDEWAHQRWLRSEDGKKATKKADNERILEQQNAEREENRLNHEKKNQVAQWDKQERLEKDIGLTLPGTYGAGFNRDPEDVTEDYRKRMEDLRNNSGDIQSIYLDVYRKYGRKSNNWTPEQLSEVIFLAVNKRLIQLGAPTYERNGKQFAVLRSNHDDFYQQTVEKAAQYDERYNNFEQDTETYYELLREKRQLESNIRPGGTAGPQANAIGPTQITDFGLTEQESKRFNELTELIYELNLKLQKGGGGLLDEAYSRRDWWMVERMKSDNMQRLNKEVVATFRSVYNAWDIQFKQQYNIPRYFNELTEQELDNVVTNLSNKYGEWATKRYLEKQKHLGYDPTRVALSESALQVGRIAWEQTWDGVRAVGGWLLKPAQTEKQRAAEQSVLAQNEAHRELYADLTSRIMKVGFGETGGSFANDITSGVGSLIGFLGIAKFAKLFKAASGINSTVAGIGFMMAGVGLRSYERAIAQGLPTDQAKLKGFLDAAAEGGPMALGVGVSKVFKGVSPGWAKWLSDKNGPKVAQGLVTAKRRAIEVFIRTLPKDLSSEVIQEIMTGFLQQGTDWYFGLDPTGMDLDQILDMAYHTTISTLFGTIGSSGLQARMSGSQQDRYHRARQQYMGELIQGINPDGTIKNQYIPGLMHQLDPKAVNDFLDDPSRKNARMLFGAEIDIILGKEGERGSSKETRTRLALELERNRPLEDLHKTLGSPLSKFWEDEKGNDTSPKDDPVIGPSDNVQAVINTEQSAPPVVTIVNADGTKTRIRVEKKDGQEITQEEANQKVEDQLNDGTLAGRDPRFEGAHVFDPEAAPLTEAEAAIDDEISRLEQELKITQEAVESGEALTVPANRTGDSQVDIPRIEQEISDLKKQKEAPVAEAAPDTGEVEIEAPELRPAEDIPVFEDLDLDAQIAAEADELDASTEDDAAELFDDPIDDADLFIPPPPTDPPAAAEERKKKKNDDPVVQRGWRIDGVMFFGETEAEAVASARRYGLSVVKVTKTEETRTAVSPGDIKFGEQVVEVTDEVYDETIKRNTENPDETWMPDGVVESIATKVMNGETLTDNENLLYNAWPKGKAAVNAEITKRRTPDPQYVAAVPGDVDASEVSEDGNYYFDEKTETWQPTEETNQSMLGQNRKWDVLKGEWVRTLPSERAETAPTEAPVEAPPQQTPTDSYGSNASQWTPEQQQEKDTEALTQWQNQTGNENAEIVTLDESDPDAQRVTSFAEQFGLRIVFATGTATDGLAVASQDANGKFVSSGVIILNADMKGDALFEVAAHEIAHGTGLDLDSSVMPQGWELENDQDLEDVWNDFLEGLDPVTRAANIAKAASDPQFARREAMAMYISKFFKSESFRNEVMGKRPGLVRKIIEFFNVFKPKMSSDQRRVIEAIKRRLNQDGFDTREGMQSVVPDVTPILVKSDFQKDLESKTPQELAQQAKDLGLKVVGRSPEALRQEIAAKLAAQSAAEGTAPTTEQADENAKTKAEKLDPGDIDARRKKVNEKDRELGDKLRNSGLLSQRAIPQEALSPTGFPKYIDDIVSPDSPFEIAEEITDHRRAQKLWDEGADLYWSHEQAERDLIRIENQEMFDELGTTVPMYVVQRSDKAPQVGPAPLLSQRAKIAAAPIRTDNLKKDELKTPEVKKRAGSAKFKHLQQVANDVSDAFGVPILSRQPIIGGWNEDGKGVDYEVPEIIEFDTEDVDLAYDLATIIAASAPEVQNSAMVRIDDPEGSSSQTDIKIKNAKAAGVFAEGLYDAGFKGFSYDPKTRQFTICLKDTETELYDALQLYIDGKREAGHIAAKESSSTKPIRLEFAGEDGTKDSYKGALERIRKQYAGHPNEQAISDIVSRAERRLDRNAEAQKIRKKAEKVIANISAPRNSADDIIKNLGDKTFKVIRDFAQWLDKRFEGIYKIKSYDAGNLQKNIKGDPKGLKLASNALTYDVLSSLAKDGSGMGWYDERIQETLRELSTVYPEIANDPLAISVYIGILSITSQDTPVVNNFSNADLVYETYKNTGKIPSDLKIYGKSVGAINGNLKFMQDMIDQYGIDGFANFMDSEISGMQLRDQYGLKAQEVNLTDVVQGNAVLGPKIGSFFNNIQGNFDTVTMDLWFTRTMHRYIGQTRADIDGPKTQQALTDFVSLLKSSKRRYDIDLGSLTTDEAIVDAALKVFRDWGSGKSEYSDKGYDKYSDGYALEKRARDINVLTGMKGAPQNKAYRVYFDSVLREAQKQLKDLGFDLTPADIQAIVWYKEKELFAASGVADNRSKPADYLDAVMSLRRDKAIEAKPESAPLLSQRPMDARLVGDAKSLAESVMERIDIGTPMADAINETLESAGVNLEDFNNDPEAYPKVILLRNLIEGFVKGRHRKANSSVDKAAAYLDQSGTTAAMEAILEEVEKTVSGSPETKHLEDMALEAMTGVESMDELAGQVQVLLDHFKDFKRPLTDREQAAVILVMNYRMAELNGLGQQLNAAIEDGNSETAEELVKDISVLEARIEDMALDNIAAGTEAGRALVSRKLGATFRTVRMDIASILNRAIATKRQKLTGDEKDTLMGLYNKHAQLEKEIEAMRESVAEEQADSVIKSRSRKARKKQTMQQATGQKPSIRDFDLADKLEQLAKDRDC